MKKIILALLLISCIALSGCAHTHKKGDLGRDSDYHWFKCTYDGCEEQIEKEEHKWDDGKITASAANDAVKTYTCKFCSAKKEEPYKMPDKPTVTKEEWESAFFSENFKNVTAKISESIVYGGDTFSTEYSIQADGATIYMVSVSSTNGSEPIYSAVYQEGTMRWTFSSPEQTIEEASFTTVSGADIMSSENLLVDYRLDLYHFYDSFTYDAVKKCYVAQDITNGLLSFSSVEVTMNNGKITEIKATTATDNNNVKITMDAYGTTKPQPPKAE
ncbi:MAG: hypothetical protein E7596_05890 [Ruminococcaceae bacterium]|nr:hypothetical protein [Oscillospiraceae bacterium]